MALRLNLYHEVIKAKALKRRDPLKISIYALSAIAAVCALATVLAVPFVPPGVPILVAAVVAALIGWFGYRSGPDGEGMEPDIDPYPKATS